MPSIASAFGGKIGVGLFFLLLCGCINEYEAKLLNDVAEIIVVEGNITDGETVIQLRRSIKLTSHNPNYNPIVDDARVYVECDDGTKMATSPDSDFENGYYTIITGNLNPQKQYRLVIEVEEVDGNSKDCRWVDSKTWVCPKKTFIYHSDYAHPILTPEINEVRWTKAGPGQLVKIQVSTSDPSNRALYYRWSYVEEWEFVTEIPSGVYDTIRYSFIDKNAAPFLYPYRCWAHESKAILFDGGEKTSFGQLSDVIIEMTPMDPKLEWMYRLTVKQNVVSKRAFDYFERIKKNVQTGGLFSPMPSELRGNIACFTEPGRPVIGYVEVSLTTQKQLIIRPTDGVFEERPPSSFCTGEVYTMRQLEILNTPPPPAEPAPKESWIDSWRPYFWGFDRNGREIFYIYSPCVDCTTRGTAVKPPDWPN